MASSNFRKPFVAVHVGAGYHSVVKEAEFNEACKRACITAMEALVSGLDPVSACRMAIEVLEDAQVTNAGIGSVLNRDGFVGCDAALMDGQTGIFGAVGAVQSVRNPIKIAHELILNQMESVSSPLVPPMFLVGSGAYQFAQERKVPVFPVTNEPCTGPMVTKDSMEKFNNHKKRLAEASNLQDTVGAICMDQYGNVAAGVSSGGISLKLPGRIGDSSIFGAGCWAENLSKENPAFACSLTGTGEQIMYNMFASRLADSVRLASNDNWNESISSTLHSFKNEVTGHREAAVGLISICSDFHGVAEFWFAHTTLSMGIGFMVFGDSTPTCQVSRKDPSTPFRLVGRSIK